MASLHRQGLVIAATLVGSIGAAAAHLALGTDDAPVAAGIWFEDVTFSSARLGGAITADDRCLIERVTMDEVSRAFHGLRLTPSLSRSGRYRVRVVQELADRRFARQVLVAGQSRGVAGFGGVGEVSFSFLAAGATVYADAAVTRTALVEAIGRGIGRSVVHELAHQILPRAPLHATRDRQSFEYYLAGRPEHYFGDMRWALARPLLAARLGEATAPASPAPFP